MPSTCAMMCRAMLIRIALVCLARISPRATFITSFGFTHVSATRFVALGIAPPT
jgi:hypothetical protein